MEIYYQDRTGILLQGDVLECLRQIKDDSIDCIITSPPYWGLRDYGIEGQIGLEPTLKEYLEKMLQITAELKRVLKPRGVMFWNHGDCYYNGRTGMTGRNDTNDPTSTNFGGWRNWDGGRKKITKIAYLSAKCMVMQNYRLILRMIDEQGWILRNVIIWYKPNGMPSSVKDRFTNAYEPVFMLVKSKKYWFDLDAVRVPHKYPLNAEEMKKRFAPETGKFNTTHRRTIKHSGDKWTGSNPLGKNPGDLWTILTQPFPEAHFATFPEKLVEPMIKAGCPQWICKKCGKARERITKKGEWSEENIPKKSWRKSYKGKIENKNSPYKRSISEIYRDTLGKGGIITIGWTDCGCNAGWKAGIVLDPFMGSGTTALVSVKLGRRWIGIELNPEYCKMAVKRLKKNIGIFSQGECEWEREVLK